MSDLANKVKDAHAEINDPAKDVKEAVAKMNDLAKEIRADQKDFAKENWDNMKDMKAIQTDCRNLPAQAAVAVAKAKAAANAANTAARLYVSALQGIQTVQVVTAQGRTTAPVAARP